MSNVLVIGNGESRKGINIDELEGYIKVGCNAIHREFQVDHLVCCDRRMIVEAAKTLNPNTLLHVRPEWYRHYRKVEKNKNVQELPPVITQGELKVDRAEHWGSGTYAILIGSLLSEDITLLGFDLYGDGNQVNNIYKGTENYGKIGGQAVDPSFWIYQTAAIFRTFHQKKFTIINKADWILPKEWNRSNVTVKTLDEFLKSS